MVPNEALLEGMIRIDEALWLRLSPLFDRAVELSSEDRTALIESLRPTSRDLAEALERLLRGHDLAGAARFLAAPLDDEALPSLAGKEFGPYSLVRPLGAGGMGTVWRARRNDGRFDKDVAVKLLNLAMLDRAGEERFRREGTLLARLDHPNIARLLDAGVSVAGQPYLVLELVEGELVDSYAASRRLGVRERLELFAQVTEAVAHAHANLVVHRDLKPSNILVDAAGRVKLLDFGVASLLDEASGLAVSRTHTLGRALTPAYAAPEQLEGGSVTTATDVYALGVLLYELLTGLHPTAARGATPAALARTLAEVEPERASAAVATLPADDPATARLLAERSSTRDLLAKALRGDLDNILAKALHKRPSDRYAAAAAMADDVGRHLLDQPVRARPVSAWYRARKFVSRHRLEVAAAASVALALASGTAVAVAQARQSARERDRAVAALRRAEVTNDLAAYLLSEATSAGRPATRAELLSRGEEMIERRFGSDPALRVHMLLTLAERYYDNSQFDDWRRAISAAFDLSRSLPDPRLSALAECTMGFALADTGEFGRADDLITGALEVLSRSTENVAEEAQCRVYECSVSYLAGDAPRAIRSGELAVELERGRDGPAGREREALAALALAYSSGERFAAADATYRELMELLDRQGLDHTNGAANDLNGWAVVLGTGGQLSRAVEVSAKGVALTRELDGDRGAHPNELLTLGNSLSHVGRHAEAVAVFDEALQKARSAGSTTGLFWALGLASRARLEAGEPEAAEALLRELETLVAGLPEPPVRLLAATERFRARAALEAGDATGAARLAKSALDRLASAGLWGRDQLPVELVLARALGATGDFEAASASARRALVVARRRQGGFPASYYVGAALLELAIAERGLGRSDEARATLREALRHLRDSSGDGAAETVRALRLAAETGGGA